MKEALIRAREEKGENFERRIESTLTGECDPILLRVHKFGDLDLHEADGVDLGDIDILALDPWSQSVRSSRRSPWSLCVHRNARKNGLRTRRLGGNNMMTMDERAMTTDVDVSIRPRKEWALLHKQKQLEGLTRAPCPPRPTIHPEVGPAEGKRSTSFVLNAHRRE